MTLIKQRLNIDAVLTPGKTGQFEVFAEGERIAKRGGNWLTRSFGAGYPDLDRVVDQLEKRRGNRAAGQSAARTRPLLAYLTAVRELGSDERKPHARQSVGSFASSVAVARSGTASML